MAFPASIDLSSLNGTNGFRLDGVDLQDFSGISVSSAGDMNGDGYDDIIIAASAADADGKDNAGESYVVFGRASGWTADLDLSSLNGANGFRLDGVDMSDTSGYSVSSAGDVNGDGYDDVIIGAAHADADGKSNTGESYVVFGKASGWMADFDLSSLNGTNGFRLDGVDADDRSGRSVSSAGDLNGDGYDDVIIGAQNAGAAGESYVVFGKASGWTTDLDLSSLNGTNGFRLDGVDAEDLSGVSVSSAGDVNGDGFDDVIIGAFLAAADGKAGSGESYVVFGKASGWSADLDLSSLNGTNGFRLDGVDASDLSGVSVSSSGDVNGDGFDDVIIGAYGADADGKNNAGESYVVFGKASGWTADFDLSSLDGTNGFRLDGVDAVDRSGVSVSSAGDVNGDGFDDFIVGAYLAAADGKANSGESYVVFGKASGWSADLDLSSLDGTNGFRLDGVDLQDSSGVSVSSAGDVNGDGFADIVIGAYTADADGKTDAGESYVVFGRGPTTAVTRIGADGDQTIRGGAFNDTLDGRAGNDKLIGGGGSDFLLGGAGNDQLYGGADGDIFFWDLGSDLLVGGEGIDYASFASGSFGTRIDLVLQYENAGLAAGDQFLEIEAFFMTQGDDLFSGDTGNNFVFGQSGNDALAGAGGGDIIFGEGGNDFINSGALSDLISGGAGADTFYYSVNQVEQDQILDFEAGVDKFAFEDTGFNLVYQQIFAGINFFTATAATGASYGAGQSALIYYTDLGLLYADTDGAGGLAPNLIAALSGTPTLSASDFLVL